MELPYVEKALSDEELLARFVRAGDQDAFRTLVERYAPLVLGTCRRILRTDQDAEDASQATFVALARKSEGLLGHASLPGWLFRVAYHASLRARKRRAHRRQHEVDWERSMDVGHLQQVSEVHLGNLIDEELQRLPGKYRTPLILCCLEGKTRSEAARILGHPLASLKWLLERGRSLLRYRLALRGVGLCSCLAAWQSTRHAAVDAEFVTATVQAALISAPANAAGALAQQIHSLVPKGTQSMSYSLRVVTILAITLTIFAAFGANSGAEPHALAEIPIVTEASTLSETKTVLATVAMLVPNPNNERLPPAAKEIQPLAHSTVELDPNLHRNAIRAVIRTEEELAKLMGLDDSKVAVKRAAELLLVREIDFRKQMVLAVSSGPSQAIVGVSFGRIEEHPDGWKLFWNSRSMLKAPQKHLGLLVLAPASDKTVVFVENPAID